MLLLKLDDSPKEFDAAEGWFPALPRKRDHRTGVSRKVRTDVLLERLLGHAEIGSGGKILGRVKVITILACEIAGRSDGVR